jgi:stage II sporulation protein D
MWPHQMQKIQAIITRSYAVRQIIERKKRQKNKNTSVAKKIYDIKRNNFHQCYDGTHKHEYLRLAVNETKGQILTYKDNVVLTMFDACCGGTIPANISGINFKKEPYLARKIPCKFCKKYKLYRWQRSIPIGKFIQYLYDYPATAAKLPPKSKICRPGLNTTKIKIIRKDKAGMTQRIQIHQGKNKAIIHGKHLWLAMKKIIRSQNFSIKKQGNKILIKGKGFGHQLGLCQRGAKELVQRGFSIKKILQFYYPKTKLCSLKQLT